MKALKYISILLMLLIQQAVMSQPRSRISILHNHIMLQLDRRSPKKSIDSLLRIAGLNNLNAEMVQKGDLATAEKQGWNVNIKGKYQVQLDISLSDLGESRITPYLISTTINKSDNRPGYPAEVLYGINSFNRVTVRELPSGLTRFFVPGNTNVRRVLVSGSFNDWSTIKGLMNKTDSGWVADIKLEPGKYAYKFIINGNWTPDTYNNLIENDGAGNMNSIYYRYNFTFKLSGYTQARHVSVSASFNKWAEIPMRLVGKTWSVQLYVHDGVHLYHFNADNNWLADPSNAEKQQQNGKPVSILKLGETVAFKLDGYTNAKNVYVAGSFNNWKPDMIRLRKTSTGWTLPYVLPSGNYLYKFLVDGQWITDPNNPHQITENGKTTSFLAVKPNHIFRLKGYNDAHKVILTGSFNNWNESGYTLDHRDGEWVISMYLKKGKYQYKLLIDGRWILDPGNKQWEQNEYGTGNSVLWIE